MNNTAIKSKRTSSSGSRASVRSGRTIPPQYVSMAIDKIGRALYRAATYKAAVSGVIFKAQAATISRAVASLPPQCLSLLHVALAAAREATHPHKASPQATDVDFTGRQRDILCLIATEGLQTKLIARRLGMAVGTVKVHLSHLYEIAGVSSRTELAVWAHDWAVAEALKAVAQKGKITMPVIPSSASKKTGLRAVARSNPSGR